MAGKVEGYDMNFTAPDLNSPIDGGNYVSELNENMSLLQIALDAIEADMLAFAGNSVVSGSNFGWLQSITLPDGPVGYDTWVPTFSTDYETLTITPPTKGFNDAVVSSLWRFDVSTHVVDLTNVVSGLGDGSWRVVVGLSTNGAGISLVVEQADGETEETADLTVWEFTLVVSGATYTAQDLHRVAHVIVASDVVDEVVERVEAVNFHVENTPISSTGEKSAGVHAPFDCEVMGAYATFGTHSAGTAVFDLITGTGGAKASVLTSSFSFSGSDDDFDTKYVAGDQVQVAAGTLMHLDVTNADATADGLVVTVLLKKIDHEIL